MSLRGFYFYLALTLSLILASRRSTRKTSVQHEEGSCYAPHFRCPDWAPCCSKNGFCGNTADYCARHNCLANCWKERDREGSEDDEGRRERRRRPAGKSTAGSRSNKQGETVFVTKANYYSRKGYK